MKASTVVAVKKILIASRFRLIAVVIVVLSAWLLSVGLTPYQHRPDAYFVEESTSNTSYVRAEVTKVERNSGEARIVEGPQKERTIRIQFYGMIPQMGGTVLVAEDTTTDDVNAVSQPWRIPVLVFLVASMIVLVLLIGGRQGLLSVVGLGVSILIVAAYVVPRVLAGADALLTSITGAFMIATIAIVIAHTWRWRTAISLLSVYVILAIVVGLAVLSGWLANLSGVYDETSSILNVGTGSLDMYGILLGGIIIASLGVLDDVVTTQVAAVDELHSAKPSVSFSELYKRGMSVGREHLSALINTLALAYVGVALPTILILAQNATSSQQLLLTLNYEYIAIEIIRIVVSSIGIILAIPLSTALAVALIGKKPQLIAILRRVQHNSRR